MNQELLLHAARPEGLRDRLLTRMLAPSLDHQLATGRSPGASRTLTIRAQQLVSPAGRQQLARRWMAVMDLAGQPPVPLTPRAPLCRGALVAAERDVREMIAVLAGGLPIAARGAAMASWLLIDGTGPLHNHRSPVDLFAVVREATEQMDAFAVVREATEQMDAFAVSARSGEGNWPLKEPVSPERPR
jgi:hypothetical protein